MGKPWSAAQKRKFKATMAEKRAKGWDPHKIALARGTKSPKGVRGPYKKRGLSSGGANIRDAIIYLKKAARIVHAEGVDGEKDLFILHALHALSGKF